MNDNTLLAKSQTILHDCLAVMGENTYSYYGVLEMSRTRDGVALNVYASVDGQKVLEVKAHPYEEKIISFAGTRYATPNLYGFKVIQVNRLNKGQWISVLHELAKDFAPPVKDDRFEPIDDAKYWTADTNATE